MLEAVVARDPVLIRSVLGDYSRRSCQLVLSALMAG
jgi:hypothetical protein